MTAYRDRSAKIVHACSKSPTFETILAMTSLERVLEKCTSAEEADIAFLEGTCLAAGRSDQSTKPPIIFENDGTICC
jgi:hypothetical protein